MGVKLKGYLTDLPTLLVQLASITPLRLLLQGLNGQKSYQDLKEPPLYDFYSTDTPPGRTHIPLSPPNCQSFLPKKTQK